MVRSSVLLSNVRGSASDGITGIDRVRQLCNGFNDTDDGSNEGKRLESRLCG